MSRHRLIEAFYGTPWAIVPDRIPVMRAVLHRWASGEKLSAEEIAAAVGDAPIRAAERRQQTGPRGVGVLPILGVMAQRTAGNVSEPGTSTDRVRSQFAQMVAHPDIGAIVLDIDSPGGSVYGLQALWDDIMAARGEKKIIAQANSLAASAAYYIASAAEEIVVSPGGEVGSIGVIAAHEDHSNALEQSGVGVTLITAGKYKGEGNPFGPLTEEGRADMQARVDAYYGQFVTAVAKGRGVKAAEVREGFGQGRVVGADRAVAEGMADRIDTLEGTLSRLTRSARAQTPRRGTRSERLALESLR